MLFQSTKKETKKKRYDASLLQFLGCGFTVPEPEGLMHIPFPVPSLMGYTFKPLL